MTLTAAGEVQLDYERAGDGEPLLLIMGMSGTALHWGERFLAAAREHFDAIAYDHRGVGASSRLTGPVTIPEMAADAAALLEALELESAHVFGISMGGMIAQELVLGRPELVRTLTIGCSYCGGPGSSFGGGELLEQMALAAAAGDRERALRLGWQLNVAEPLLDDEGAFEVFRAITARRAVATPVVMAQMQACAAHDTHDRLGAVAAPTLVLHGTKDLLLPYPNGELIASLIPGARLETLTDRAHMFVWEDPTRAAELLAAHARG